MPNNRLFFAIQQAGFAKIGTQTFTAIHGLQSLGMTTAYDLQQFFEIGQLAIYHNAEQLPNVEVTLEKALDGYPPAYLLATNGVTSPTLVGRSAVQTIFGMSIFNETQTSSSGTPISQLQSSGMFVSSVGYNFDVNGPFTENLTLVGTTKVWKTTAPFQFSGQFLGNNDVPLSLSSGTGGVQRRQNLVWSSASTGLDANSQTNFTKAIPGTTLPPDIPGISSSGTNNLTAGVYGAHVQTISTSANLGREPLYELGRKSYYFRYVQFPVSIQTDITIIATDGDLVNCTEAGVNVDGTNLTARTIKVATQEGLFLDLGINNKLSNISTSNGGVDGGNVTHQFSYTTQNDFTVTHTQDPSGL